MEKICYIYLLFSVIFHWIIIWGGAGCGIYCRYCCCCCCFLTVWSSIQRRHSIQLKPVLWVRYWSRLCDNGSGILCSKGLNYPIDQKTKPKTKKWKKRFSLELDTQRRFMEERQRERESYGLFFYFLVFCPFICLAKTNSPAILWKRPMKWMEETVKPKPNFFFSFYTKRSSPYMFTRHLIRQPGTTFLFFWIFFLVMRMH